MSEIKVKDLPCPFNQEDLRKCEVYRYKTGDYPDSCESEQGCIGRCTICKMWILECLQTLPGLVEEMPEIIAYFKPEKHSSAKFADYSGATKGWNVWLDLIHEVEATVQESGL